MIHVNDPGFSEHLFRENFNMHTSTSPQYGLIASLDVARKQAVMEGYKLLVAHARSWPRNCASRSTPPACSACWSSTTCCPRRCAHDGIRLDPTKVTVDISGCGYTVDELQKELFERYNIQVEKSTFNTLTLLLTIGTTRSKVSRLYDALMRIAREKRAPRRLVRTPGNPGLHQAALPAARRLLLRRRAGAGVRRHGARQPRARAAASAPTRSCPTRPASRCWCPAS